MERQAFIAARESEGMTYEQAVHAWEKELARVRQDRRRKRKKLGEQDGSDVTQMSSSYSPGGGESASGSATSNLQGLAGLQFQIGADTSSLLAAGGACGTGSAVGAIGSATGDVAQPASLSIPALSSSIAPIPSTGLPGLVGMGMEGEGAGAGGDDTGDEGESRPSQSRRPRSSIGLSSARDIMNRHDFISHCRDVLGQSTEEANESWKRESARRRQKACRERKRLGGDAPSGMGMGTVMSSGLAGAMLASPDGDASGADGSSGERDGQHDHEGVGSSGGRKAKVPRRGSTTRQGKAGAAGASASSVGILGLPMPGLGSSSAGLGQGLTIGNAIVQALHHAGAEALQIAGSQGLAGPFTFTDITGGLGLAGLPPGLLFPGAAGAGAATAGAADAGAAHTAAPGLGLQGMPSSLGLGLAALGHTSLGPSLGLAGLALAQPLPGQAAQAGQQQAAQSAGLESLAGSGAGDNAGAGPASNSAATEADSAAGAIGPGVRPGDALGVSGHLMLSAGPSGQGVAAVAGQPGAAGTSPE